MRNAQRETRERVGTTLASLGARRGVVPGFVLVVAASFALFALQLYQALWNAPELGRGRERVVHTFEVIASARSIERALGDAQGGMRAYLLTGDEASLGRYRSATRELPALTAKLKRLTADNPEQQQIGRASCRERV